ncbi:DUF4245 domain-containing protein [Stackebrandtia nassauensis]|nr:DUF4245 domain-containing protein [Stackebrandtia nassauensis]
MSTEAGPAPKRGRLTARRPRDMIISLAILLVPIGLIFVGWRFLMGDQDVNPVDFSETVGEAERAGLPVVEPDGLSGDWVPISHSVDEEKGAVTLRIGYLTPDEAGLQLVESDAKPDAVIDAALGEESPTKTGSTEVAGREWQTYTTADGHSAFVSTDDDMTIAVVGDAASRELKEFTAALD